MSDDLRERIRAQYGDGIPAKSYRQAEGLAPVTRSPAPGKVQRAPVRPTPSLSAGRVLVSLDYGRREGDVLRLELPFPPRTKKNHGQAFGIKQSQGYIRFKTQVIDHVARMATTLKLPLPADVPYNAAALFYVDNDAADTVGLMQGLADALQDAGVLPNDRQLRTWNGTDQWLDKTRPRVEVTLTPIPKAA